MLHILSMKNKTRNLSIRPIADADVLRVPLSQHIGAPAVPVVSPGEHVLQYQLIGKAAATCSANIHAPVSGMVEGIDAVPLAGGGVGPAVIIRNDHRDEQALLPGDDLSVQELLRLGGVVGEGGAQFPTDLKYNPADDGRLHTLVVNGTECEPYLTADYALMNERTEKVLQGAEILRAALHIPEVVIVMERQNRALERRFRPFLERPEYKCVRLLLLPDSYPQGGELQVVRSVTGIEIPRGTLPREAGVIVNNTGTVYAAYCTVKERKPVVSRILTVSGEEAGTYGNFEVKIGTPVSHILRELGLSAKGARVVMGGPMMGKYVSDVETPVMKGTSGILLLHEKDLRRENCISCGYCVDACTMHLMPMKFEELVRKGRYAALADYDLDSCLECAACEYICPSNVALMASIKKGKMKLREMAK